ncbi:MAG: hypothetical protein WKF91_08415 [Segetibacter sp.]
MTERKMLYTKQPEMLQNLFVVFFISALLIGFNCAAQEFGGNPSALKWQQINTDTARIIFPEGLDETGKRVASVIHELQKNHASTIGNKVRKVNIVLQNQSTISNAYVGLGPYRSEFYLFAPQNSFELGALNWADNLAVHEYRHVQQYSNFNVGLSKAFSILFGQQGQAIANAAAVPDWFFEGDAVFSETALTNQGRGRIPDFFNGYQSLYQQGRRYSYMKLRNGSLRNYVPGHYELGYLLVAYGREKYGSDFWRKVSQDAAAFKPLIYPWQGAVKKYSGINYRQFVSDAIKFYNDKWQQAKGNTIEYITPVHKNYVTHYKYPYTADDGSLIVLKRSYRQIPAIYRIKSDGTEEKITVRTIANDDYFSYSNGKIVFASHKPDERWGYREFSDITLVDAASGVKQKITHKERYFSPDISHDGQKVAAVDMRANQMSNIVVVDLKGQKIFRSTAMRGLVYTYPKFSANDQFIYSAVRNQDGNMSLVKLELATGKESRLLPYHNRIIGFPTVQGDTIFFSSSYRGSDEIWAFVESKNQIFRVAVNPTGFYQAVFQQTQNRLVASNFTANGYRLAALPASALLWQPVGEKENSLPDLYVPNALQQEDKATLESIPVRSFETRKYHKSFNLLNFHSWRPDYADPNFSFTVFGQNILNTLQTELSYTYNRNESSHKVGLDAIYGGWYLQPTLGVNQTWNRTVVQNRDTTFTYNELNGRTGLRIPLNFSGGRMYRNLTLSTTYNKQQVYWTGIGKRLLRNRNFDYMEGRIAYTQQIQKAVQHIYPRVAQTLSLQYRRSINKLTANQLLLNGGLYFPGVHTNHNIIFTASYQQRDTMNQYLFSNNFPFSRGYTAVDFPRMWKVGANYHFPLLYPDWGFGNIVYFQRVRGNGFYDYTQTKSLRTGTRYNFSTIGAEIFFDTKWWNQQAVSFGIRYSHLLDKEYRGTTNPNQWEFILPVGLFN